jgi:ubiquinone/menaquinone biosynthesis C-methylase UbiE
MGDENLFSRLFSFFWFDMTHLDKETLQIYTGFISDKIRSVIRSEPDLSSEIFHWKRYYHQQFLENPDKQVFCRESPTKKSILFSLEKLRSRSSDILFCLDVGCGPTSQFYTNDLVHRDDLQIITVDPLAEIYKNLNKKYCPDYSIECIAGYGEHLTRLFTPESFHLIYSQNALDHSQDPQEFLKNLDTILKPGGFLILHGFVDEGSAAHWLGLHQWNIDIENNDVLLTNKSRTINRKNLTKTLGLIIAWKSVEGHAIGDKYTLIYTKKNRTV